MLDAAVRAILRRWRRAVIENADTAETYLAYARVPFQFLHEIMLYKDAESFACWERLGADPSNANTMIHLLSYRRGQITVVVDEAEELEMSVLLRAIQASLEDACLRMGFLEAA